MLVRSFQRGTGESEARPDDVEEFQDKDEVS